MCDCLVFPREGTAYVNARAILENPRIIPGRRDSFVFDVVLCCSLPMMGTQVVCSLCYLTREDNEYVDVGIYDIYAKIVSFRPDTHPKSPTRPDGQFVLMGDLLHFWPVSRVTDMSPNELFPATLTVSGRVTSLQRQIHTFTVSLSQMIRQAPTHRDINIRGVLGIRPMWPDRSHHLPCTNNNVTFTGDLLTYDTDVAVVAVDDMTYLPHPPTPTYY
ncbi:hypothetical protein EDB85DRAFT_2025059 [Lactarius pseudohatsudake]|nr:hypothetical protein EDB85DRAFT_2025059 [Lactarius pseudohatsudake]